MLGHGGSMIDFEKNSYTVVKGLIEPEWCKTLYNYIGYSADRCGLKQKHDEERTLAPGALGSPGPAYR